MDRATPPPSKQEGLKHHQSGRLDEAERIYRQLLGEQPGNAELLHLLGVLRGQAGDSKESIELLVKAARANQRDPVLLGNLGEAYRSAGKFPEAIAALGRAVELGPGHCEAHRNLASALRQHGRLDEAIAACRKAVSLRANYPEAWNDLGNLLAERKQFGEAIKAYGQAVEGNPRFAEAIFNLGIALGAAGQKGQAVEAYRRAVAIKGDYVAAWNNLGNALREMARFEEALGAFKRALEISPGTAETHNNFGLALWELDRTDLAIAAYRKAISLKPDYAEALINLGNAVKATGKFDEAIALYRRAIEVRPEYAEAYVDLGNALKEQGELDEAIAAFRMAMKLKPEDPLAHSNLILCLHFHPETDAAALAREHALWNANYARPLRGTIRGHDNDRGTGRRLRVGYLSPDFRNHPVGRFLLPLLRHHDRAGFEIFAYSLSPAADSVTKQLRSHVDEWRQLQGLSDQEAAETIRGDKIDILVDLAMHTGGNGLRIMARKPAPVQFTYLAYCSSTGLETIDYRLSDPYLDPPELDDSCYSERTIRLPATWWCYEPVGVPGNLAPRRARGTGGVTFGCLNAFGKISEPAMGAWGKILREAPGSRILLHAGEGAHRRRCVERFEKKGIAAERIGFVGFVPMEKYFAIYDQIDIGLDPFPYCGGTTTCDALWMGVPVITLSGRTAVGRVGHSILSNVGLAQFVAASIDEYVEKAVDLAANIALREELGRGLRKKMKHSVLMDGGRFARDVEGAYRLAWGQWANRGG